MKKSLERRDFLLFQASIHLEISKNTARPARRDTARNILMIITHLMHVQSQNSPINVWYCYPGEIWIAKKLKISLATTERGVRLLRESGWIVTRRRRKKPGRGSRTQLYFPGKKMMSALKKAGL